MRTRWRQRTIWALLAGCAAAGCGGGGEGLTSRNIALSCSADVQRQRQEIRDIMLEWYFFNDELEQQQKYTGLDLNTFPTAEDLLAFLRYRPNQFDRGFSFITTPLADSQFFGEGQFVGFGFGSKFVDSPLDAELRLTQVFPGSPAAAAGFARGQRIVTINGRTIAEIGQAEGLSAALGTGDVGVTRTFRLRDSDGGEFEVAVAKALVTIDPVPSTAIFDIAGVQVGYVDFRTFISTADDELDLAFAEFESQNVSALVVDLRYNGGGLVSTAERLADLIGGAIAEDRVLSETLFSSAKSAFNSIERFQHRPGSLTLLRQVVFITTGSSASASELVINALSPHTVVTLVGSVTFGKPVGQSGFPFCDDELLLRPVTFETVNSLNEGQYFDGLGVTCGATDGLQFTLGDPTEPSLATALEFIETGSCGSVVFRSTLSAPAAQHQDIPLGPEAEAAQRLLGAY